MTWRGQHFILWGVLLLLASFLVPTDAMAQAANLHDPSGSYTGLLDLVRNNAQQWDGQLRTFAMRLFWLLATIQLVWTFMPLVFRQADLGEIVGELLRFILVIGFFYALLLFSADWAEAMVYSFRQAGAVAAGLGETAIRPGDIFGVAVELANTISDVDSMNPLVGMAVAIASVIVLLCFAFIAAFMGLTIIESYVVINASVLFMGFGGSQWTREYALAIVRYAVSVGAKLFILTLLVGLIIDSAKQWQAAYTHDDASMWTMIGLALVCAYFAKTIPELVAGMISGASMGGGSSIGGMAAAGAAGAAAAIATIATAGAAAPAAAGMLGAAGSGAAAGGAAAGAGGIGAGGLAGAINSSFAGSAGSAGASSVAGSASGLGASTGGGAAAKGAASAGSRVGGANASAAQPGTAPKPSGSVQQAAKQASKAGQGGDDDKGQPAAANPQAGRASSADSPSSSSGASGSPAATSSGQAIKSPISKMQVASGLTKGAGILSAISVPGMEGAAGLSLGVGAPQPTPGADESAPSMSEDKGADNSEPQNVIRPAGPDASDSPGPSDNGPASPDTKKGE